MAGRFILAASTALALVAAGAFGVTVFGQRPLAIYGDGAITCAPRADAATDQTFGIWMENLGTTDVTLKSVDFDTIEGLEITEAWVASNDLQDDGTILGYGLMPYPPLEGHPGWKDRVPIAGAVVSPDDDVSLVVRFTLDPDASSAFLHGANLHYSGSGTALGATAEAGAQFGFYAPGEESSCDL